MAVEQVISADIAGTRVALDTTLASPAELAYVRRVRGVQSLRGAGLVAPLYPDAVLDLQRAGVALSARLRSYLIYAGKTREYVETQKTSPARPEMMFPMPLKPEFVPYDHQVRAYNISLALLLYLHGWDEEGGDRG